jgi:hypothetical protein
MALDESRRAHYADVRAWSACVGLLVRFKAAEASLVLPRKEPRTRPPRLGADAPVIPKLIRKRNEELATAGAVRVVDIRIGPSLHLAAVGVVIGRQDPETGKQIYRHQSPCHDGDWILGMGCLSLGSRRILPQERDHEEHPADRQASPAEDRDQGEAVPLRHLPQTEPAAGEDACTVVLPAVRGGEGGAVSEY